MMAHPTTGGPPNGQIEPLFDIWNIRVLLALKGSQSETLQGPHSGGLGRNAGEEMVVQTWAGLAAHFSELNSSWLHR
jgi:hypothetical protein